MKRARLVVGLVAAIGLLVSACSGDSDSEISGGRTPLTFWVSEEGGLGSFLKTLEEDFEAEQPDIDLQVTVLPEANYDVKLQTVDRCPQDAGHGARLRP